MRSRFTSALQAPFADRAFRAFLQVYFGVSILYRTILVLALFASESPPLGAARSFWSAAAILSGLAYDLVLIALVVAVHIVWHLLRANATHGHAPGAGIWARLAFAVILLWHSVVLGSHLNLLFTMNTGFTWSMFVEFLTVLGFKDFFALLGMKDYLAMVLPQIAFLLLLAAGYRFTLRMGATAAAMGGLFLTLAETTPARSAPRELVQSPHLYLLGDAWKSLTATRGPASVPVTGVNLAIDDPVFYRSRSSPDARPIRGRVDANVIFIILESTAREYIFDTRKYAGGKMPMPYLWSLAQKSLYFSRHFASNNSSPRSIFSIFSGLYESPETRFFSMENDLQVPHLIDLLGKNYARFLVTPADLNWYFPRAWFKNRGFTDLEDYSRLKQLKEYRAGPTPARDEFESVAHFNARVAKMQQPFVGVYYTFVGHWPYPDIGPEHRIIQPASSRDRYVNNLYAQDKLIRQIIENLEATGRIENSIVVIVGDHGEAFYQHPGNRVHSGESYNENIASPLIIYSPKLLQPATITEPTVHADIVPTLLDTLGIAYRRDRFQGESLLRPELSRKYVFTYGNENTLTAVARDLQKVQILYSSKSCRSFDLAADPAEQNLLPCETGGAQYLALQKFYSAQPGMIKGYNNYCKKNGC
jgi:lipoteichoic acid synthase